MKLTYAHDLTLGCELLMENMQPMFLNDFAHELSGYCSLWVHVYYWV